MKKIKNKKSKNLFSRVLTLFLILISTVLLCLLMYINLLPNKYLTIISIGLIAFDLFQLFFLNVKNLKKKIRKITYAVTILAITLLTTGTFYLCKTLGVLQNNGDSKYKIEHYSVIVLKDSKYNNIKDIKNIKVSYYSNSLGSKDAIKKLKLDANIKTQKYDNSNNLASDLLNSKVKVILIEDSIKSIMNEEIENFEKNTKVIYKFSVKIKTKNILKEVNVTEKPFAVYISGIDTYGEISSVSRSDVNMIMVVNPKTHQVLLISAPRDYYVQLHGTKGSRDKLTHAGIYGIDMSIKTLEDLLDFDVNYYLKVNFTSVIDIVDALGGLDVYSEYTFVSYSNFSFKEGMNRVNGEEALDFARTRKAFANGDRQRGINQQALIEAIIRKVSSKSIITKYNSLLNAVNGKYQTNMSTKKIMSLVKMQLNDMPSWNITSYSLEGTDSKNYTYTYGQLLYVMEPDEDSVIEAQNLIDKVLNGETLESSYNEIGGSSNSVKKVYVAPSQPVKTPIKEEEKISKKDFDIEEDEEEVEIKKEEKKETKIEEQEEEIEEENDEEE